MQSTRTFFSIAAITVIFSALMWLYPQIDLTISSWFYQPQRGFLFASAYNQFHLGIFRDSWIYLTYGLIIVLSLMLIGSLLFKRIKMPVSPTICLFLITCFAIAPALVVNDILKNHWGRARPYQIQQFGGDKQFTPAWALSMQCTKNCSFTSGETANVFCYFALLFITRRKKLIAGIVGVMGLLMAFERIAQGDHFFSDTLLSGFLDYLLIWLIYQVMKKSLNQNRRNHV